MEPSRDEAEAMTSVEKVCDWAELAGAPREAFLGALGLRPGTHVRVVAGIPEADYEEVCKTVRVPAANPSDPAVAPTAAVISQMALVGRTARLLCGLVPSQQQKKDLAERELKIREALAKAPASSKATSAERTKLSEVIDQISAAEIDPLPDNDVEAAYALLKSKTGELPAEDEDLTSEQLSALSHLVTSNKVPYADFAVWGPFGVRIRRRTKFTGHIIGPNGDLAKVELLGPACCTIWCDCYLVLRTGLMMLDQVDAAVLDRYRNQFCKFVARFGEEVWAIAYQADVRCRLEHMPRLRNQAIEERRESLAAGARHEYDPKRPWAYVWKRATNDAAFWKRELEDPAGTVIAKLRAISAFVDGDAPTDSRTALAALVAPPATGATPATRPLAAPRSFARESSKAKKTRLHDACDGKMRRNRAGKRLCQE